MEQEAPKPVAPTATVGPVAEYKKMNPEIKAQWVAALRSGEYAQGKGYLLTGLDSKPSFCCLGVATELYRKSAANISGFNWEMCELGEGEYELDGDADLLPQRVVDWMGLESNDGPVLKVPQEIIDKYKIPEPPGTLKVAVLNDRGVPFSVIADLIEEQF